MQLKDLAHIRSGTRFVGRSVPRREDRGPLTGGSRYIADVKLAGMLEVVFVRSTEAHARIVSVDTSEARALDGVEAVFTATDLAGVHGFPDHVDLIGPVRQRPLATDRVRYVGAPYAAVVATDRYVAEDGAALVAAGTDYEPLPTVADVQQALAPGAPKLYDGWDGNCSVDVTHPRPEVDRALAEADRTFTATYVSQRQTGLPIETRGVVADMDGGTLTVWTSTQSPHMVRTTIALMLGVPEPQVRVIHPVIGGGFGVKTHIYPEDIVVPWIARRLGRPARWIEDRMESLLASVHARDQRHDVEVAYDDDGTIRAVRCTSTLDLGSGEIFYPGTAPVFATNSCITGAYDLSNVATRAVAVVTNKTPSGAYRGFGIPESTLVIERVIDRVARRTGNRPGGAAAQDAAAARPDAVRDAQRRAHRLRLPHRVLRAGPGDGRPCAAAGPGPPRRRPRRARRRGLRQLRGADLAELFPHDRPLGRRRCSHGAGRP